MRVVRSLDELMRLPQDRHVNGFRGRLPLTLEIPDVARPAQLQAQDLLNGLQERRGSLAGAAMMFVTLLVGIAKVLHENVSLLAWRAVFELGLVLGAAFALGFVAQCIALVVTRWQFARRCHELHDEFSRRAGSVGAADLLVPGEN